MKNQRVMAPPKLNHKAINEVRTKIWFDRLSRQAGEKTPYWFAKHTGIGSISTRTWARYKTGESTPRIFNGIDPVAELAVVFPNSDLIYYSPLWKVLKGQSFTFEDIDDHFQTYGHTLRTILLGRGLWKRELNDDGSFLVSELLRDLLEIHTFNALEALILLIAAADSVPNIELRNTLDAAYRELIPHLILNEAVPFIGEMFDLTDQFSCKWEFEHGYALKSEVRSWREELPRYREMLVEHYAKCLVVNDGFIGISREILNEDVLRNFAEAMVEHAWRDEKSILKSANMWAPMGWELAKVLRRHPGYHPMTEERLSAIMRDEVSCYLNEKIRPEEAHPFSVKLSG